ncbi:L-tryptophan--pyruvate aminotransferase [Salvia divinorum]|uniref:L-tryptophan--pyruvate aminotransferase n=1 Tax=Salvia divinorum TaxID=28513 RepID=A0ABD1G8D8_SALDI
MWRSRMVKFMEMNSTIGVSKETQLRVVSILEMISINSCLSLRIRAGTDVPDFPPQYCNFKQDCNECNPTYAWLKAQEPRGGRDQDLDLFLKSLPSIIKHLAH